MSPVHFVGHYGALSAAQRRAIVELVTPRYVAMSYPTMATFAADYGLTPGTPACADRWAELHRLATASLAASYADRDGIAALFAIAPDGANVALATMQTIRGTRLVPVADAIGTDDPDALPTNRMFRGFRYPPAPDHLPATTTEADLAEFSRLVVADPVRLRALVADGTVTAAEADAVVQRGLDVVVALAIRHALASPTPPRAFLFNTKPRLARVLRRKGLALQPLFLDGTEPTPALLHGGRLSSSYYRRWSTELARVVPPTLLMGGLGVAIRYLAGRGFRAWHTLAISLPYLLPVDDRLVAAVARMATVPVAAAESSHKPAAA